MPETTPSTRRHRAGTPDLSIVMPVLDEAQCVVTALDRLAAWQREGVEVIVVDGGSVDGTAALASGRADAVIASPPGRALQMNAGAARARGGILLFLHADTRLPADAPAAIARALARGAAWGRFDVSIEGRSALFPLIAALMNWRSALSGIATGDQAMFMRCSAFGTVGGFPEQPLMEDVALSRALLRLGRPARLRGRAVTSGRRWEKNGVWSTIWMMWRLRWLYWRGTPVDALAEAYR